MIVFTLNTTCKSDSHVFIYNIIAAVIKTNHVWFWSLLEQAKFEQDLMHNGVDSLIIDGFSKFMSKG